MRIGPSNRKRTASESPSSRQKKWKVEKIPAPIDLALSLEEPALYYEQYQQLADEILERVETLKEFGAFTVLADIIEEITGVSETLSSLVITDDYRIYLKDYQMKEIRMRPIEKALYLLYLKYPDGINFKELANYEEELLYIYREVSMLTSFSLLFIPCIDVIRVAIERKIHRKDIFEADRTHIHHRIMQIGLDMHQTLFVIITLFIAICLINYGLYVGGLQSTYIYGIDIAIYLIFIWVVNNLKSSID